MQKVIYILILSALIVSGCSSLKKSGLNGGAAGKGKADENTIESIIQHNLSNNDFHIQKADINVDQNNVSVHFTASIKFRRPDTLLITVRSRTGIEAGRALITRDTILINDRINKKLLIGSPSVIGPKYGIDPSLIFVLMGDVIVGDDDRKSLMNCVGGTSRNEFEINGKQLEYLIDCGKGKATEAYFTGDIRSGNITMSFSNIVVSDYVKYPQKIVINDDLNSINIRLDIRKIESPWKGRIGFIPGAGFKVIKIR